MGSIVTTLPDDSPVPASEPGPLTLSPLLRLPSEVWGEITSFFGSDGRDLRAMMSAGRSAYRLLCSPSAVTRLHINLGWKTKLKITAWPSEWFAKFPGVVSIGLSLNPGSRVLFSVETVQALPRNLRHLHLGFVDSIGDTMLPYLPPLLLTLDLEKNFRITDRGIKNLPEFLETLHLPENTITSSHCIPHLPSTLKHLSIRTTDEIGDAIMRLLPNLKSLKLCGSSRLPGPSISALPPSITTLTWALRHGLDPFLAELINRSLTDLTCHIPDEADLTLASLPPSLLRLTITHGGEITSKGIELLPRGLLRLELISDNSLPVACIRHLPPNLQYLYLHKNSKWEPNRMMDLPPSIHTLKLGQNANFTNASFAVLPPRLFFFSCLWNEEITEEFLKWAPPSLRRLELKARYEDAEFQSIDLAFSNSLTLPRCVRERTTSGNLINTRPYDTHLFEVDPVQSYIKHIDVSPKNIPTIWAKSPPPPPNYSRP